MLLLDMPARNAWSQEANFFILDLFCKLNLEL